MVAPAAIQDDEAPSQLADSHRNIRPQLSQAVRRLYFTTTVLAGLAILKLYFECLGTTWTGNPARGPIVFFRAADMADTSKWQRLPAESDKNPAEAYSFAESAEPLSWTRFRQIIRTRASPRPPTIGLIS